MLALELTNVKDFMNKLLKSETFDNFLLQEAVITSAASYVIDGHIHDGFLFRANKLCILESLLRLFLVQESHAGG